MAKSTKKGFKLPHTFVIIIFIVLVATAMTWIIPAGEFVRYENASGRTIIDPNQFSYIDQTPVNPLLIPLYIVNAICSRIDLMLVIMFSGGAFSLISKSGCGAPGRRLTVWYNRCRESKHRRTTVYETAEIF